MLQFRHGDINPRPFNTIFSMKHVLLTLVLFSFILISPGQAKEQPVSVSLGECSAIFLILEASAEKQDSRPANVQRLALAAKAFLKAAYKQARIEGQQNPGQYIDKYVQKFIPEWNDTLAGVYSIQETRDWMTYCSALGKEEGILPLKREKSRR